MGGAKGSLIGDIIARRDAPPDPVLLRKMWLIREQATNAAQCVAFRQGSRGLNGMCEPFDGGYVPYVDAGEENWVPIDDRRPR